ncbi:MAG: hypothetical protein ACQKBT_12055 [Puniceicoccales bacterium]
MHEQPIQLLPGDESPTGPENAGYGLWTSAPSMVAWPTLGTTSKYQSLVMHYQEADQTVFILTTFRDFTESSRIRLVCSPRSLDC